MFLSVVSLMVLSIAYYLLWPVYNQLPSNELKIQLSIALVLMITSVSEFQLIKALINAFNSL